MNLAGFRTRSLATGFVAAFFFLNPQLFRAQQLFAQVKSESSTPASNQELETQKASQEKAIEVIHRAIIARGGYEVLQARKSRHSVYRVTSQGKTWHWENYIQDGTYLGFHDHGDRMAKWRVESFIPAKLGKPVEGIVWTENNGIVSQRIDLFSSVYMTERSFVTLEPNWRRQFKRLEFAGQEEVQGKPANHVRFLNFKDVWMSRFYDVETGLLVRSTRPNFSNEDLPDTIIDNYDYQPQGKFQDHLVSTRQTINIAGRHYDYKLVQYECNLRLPEFVFEVPESMKAQFDKIERKRQAQRAAIAEERRRLRLANHAKSTGVPAHSQLD